MNSASLCGLAGRYDNPISHRFLAPIDCLKIPALIYCIICLVESPSIYRGRAKIGGMYLPCQLERTYTTTLFVTVDRVKGGGRAPPTPSPGWIDFTIRMECTVHKKVDIATLCVLCGWNVVTIVM
jgi:hypothetical protein